MRKKLTLAQRLAVELPKVLELLPLGDKGANNYFTPITPVHLLSKSSIQCLVPSLRLTASKHGLASLSACQANAPLPIVLVNKGLVNDKWEDYQCGPEDFDVYVNPKMQPTQNLIEDGWEQCPSLPGIEAYCRRYHKILLKYMNFSGEWLECEKSGFEARVIQHEIDHNSGTMMIQPKVSFMRLRSKVPHIQEIISRYDVEINERELKLENSYKGRKELRKIIDKSPLEKELAFRMLYNSQEFELRLISDLCRAILGKKPNNSPFDEPKFQALLLAFDPVVSSKQALVDMIDKLTQTDSNT